jgi:hypothetical protein
MVIYLIYHKKSFVIFCRTWKIPAFDDVNLPEFISGSIKLWNRKNGLAEMNLFTAKTKRQNVQNLRKSWKRLWTRHSHKTKTMSKPTLGPYLQQEQIMPSNDEWR